MQREFVTILDWAMVPIYAFILFVIVRMVWVRNRSLPGYQYFRPAVLVKCLGGLAFALIYVYYYDYRGDTIAYYMGTKAMTNLAMERPDIFFQIMLGDLSPENYSAFHIGTGYPPRSHFNDPHTFAVVRYGTPLYMISAGNYLVMSLLMGFITFTGAWKLYQTFLRVRPDLPVGGLIAAICIPSCVFWGSGLLKDPFSFAGLGFAVWGFYNFFIEKRKMLQSGIYLILGTAIILSIKPYVILALFPGMLIWMFYRHIKSTRNMIVKYLLWPGLSMASGILLMVFFSNSSDMFGKFSIDRVSEQVYIMQDDLRNSWHYGDNRFELPMIDGTPSSFLRASPVALNAALFRPYIWEAKIPIMLLSALENFLILCFVIRALAIHRLGIFRRIAGDPFLIFCTFYVVLMGLAVGLSTPLFGALVRYKIPLMPFLFMALWILNKPNTRQNGKDQALALEGTE